MWETLTVSRLTYAVSAIISAWLLYFFQRLYHHRTSMHNLPGPPHSWIWGSLPAVNEIVKRCPKRVAGQKLFLPLKERYNLGDYYYLDLFPFAAPTLVIFDTDLLHQITVKTSLPKHRTVDDFVRHVGGPGNLVSAEGAEWKKWRTRFNPGFSASHLMTLVPLIVDQCEVFADIMEKRARKKSLFRMEQATTKLTVDIIGKVVLDLDFNKQKDQPNALVDGMIRQLPLMFADPITQPWTVLDFTRHFRLYYNTWQMNRYCSQRLDERFATRAGRGKSKTVIDLALDAHIEELKRSGIDIDSSKKLDPEFKRACISNLKMFLFAGHDTTSGTICYVYYYLSKAPDKLVRVREELDDVFGTDINRTADQIKQGPHLLNKLEYMMAVIKETLRLQPPASTLRKTQEGFVLRDPDTGDALPLTPEFMIFPVDVGYHRLQKHWGDPHVFRPERFLPSSNDHHNKDAWIPFSKGIRNCIGQELALIESKIILAMTLRNFDFQAAYDELDKLKGDGTGYPCDMQGIQEMYDDPAYQIQLGTAKPREGMPCRLFLRK